VFGMFASSQTSAFGGDVGTVRIVQMLQELNGVLAFTPLKTIEVSAHYRCRRRL